MARKRRTKARPRSLTVSIHGDGIDIEAEFKNSRLGDVVADAVRRTTTGPIVAGPAVAAAKSEHDFDAVRRVIKHADPKVLQAIVDLAKHELETRQNAS